MIWDVIVSNTNALTAVAELDFTGDETSFAFNGFGESASGLIRRVEGKPGMSKGGQIALVSDTNCIRIRAYHHRHKCHARTAPFTQEGPYEVKTLLDTLSTMVVGSNLLTKKIYSMKPHGTFDNCFSGDHVMDYAGKLGFGLTVTCRRDCFPKDIQKEHLHTKRTDSSLPTKVARFFHPVVAVMTTNSDTASFQ